jgi:hypothetical protein
MDRLAKQQACQLFIEQEIEKGLKEGKTKYKIGKEVAKWIKKLFDADVKPKTVAKRAERMANEIATNVANESTPENDSGNGESPVAEAPTTAQGIIEKMKADLAEDGVDLEDDDEEWDAPRRPPRHDSPDLIQLKVIWERTKKTNRKTFLRWIKKEELP